MMTNQTIRVLELLKRFNNGQMVCISSLQHDSLWYGKSEKTIRRDLDVIKEAFPDSFELVRGEKGCYKAITKDSFNQFLNKDVLSLMVQTFNLIQNNELFESMKMNEHDKKILKSKIEESNKVYEFKNKPFETKSGDTVLLRKIENAIKFNKCLKIEYEIGNKIKEFDIKPYKVVFINENFYLASEVENEHYVFSPFRLSKIISVKDSSKTFYLNPEIVNFIKEMQTPFSKFSSGYRTKLIDVVVEIDSAKSYFFKTKNFLKSQKIVSELDNGNVVVSYRVTQLLEIEELIKRWLPHIKILEPFELKQSINSQLLKYLELDKMCP